MIFIVHDCILIQHDSWIERLLMKLPRRFVRLEAARIGDDYGWTKVMWP